MFTTVRTVLVASLWAAARISPAEAACPTGLHMIVARGSDEPQYPPQIPGYGDLGRVVDRIKQRINDSDAYAVVYPAASAVSQNPYQVESIRQGSEAARKAIMDYATECPGHKIALLGYSQGAQVIGNSICGDRGGWMNGTVIDYKNCIQFILGLNKNHLQFAKIQSLVEDDIISVVLMGDPTYRYGAPFNQGTSKSSGIWPREWDAAPCNSYANITQSYCSTGDAFCDSSSAFINPSPHIEYVHEYGTKAVEFMIKRWNAVMGKNLPDDGGPPFAVTGKSFPFCKGEENPKPPARLTQLL